MVSDRHDASPDSSAEPLIGRPLPLSADAVLDGMPEGFLLLDDRLRVCHCNPAALRLFGIAAVELTGRTPWLRASVGEAAEAERQCRRTLDVGQASRFTLTTGNGIAAPGLGVRAFAASGGLALLVCPLSDHDASTERGDDSYHRLLHETGEMRVREEGMRFLADASAALTASLDERMTLDTLARLSVEKIADGAMVTLLRRDGSFDHVATRSRDGVTGEYAAETERLYPLPPDAPSGYPRAISTGEPELIAAETFDQTVLPMVAADAVHLERLRKLDMYSGMVVPLTARAGTIGAMTLVLHGSPRRRAFDRNDLTLASELGRRAGLAIENARLFAAEQRARAEAERAAELTRRLQEITAAFARTLTIEEAASTTLTFAQDLLHAESGVVYRMSDAGDALELVLDRGLADVVVDSFRRVPLDMAMPVTDAVRTRELVVLPARAEALRRYQGIEEINRHVQSDAWIAVPFLHDGAAVGAVALGFDAGRHLSATHEALADALARHCAQAMERARLLQGEREARAEAERANQAKSDLLAKVSHETRQPVHASLGWADTLDLEIHGPLNEAQRDALRRIKQNQSRLLGVLNDLLDMSRIAAGKLELDMQTVILADVVDGVESAVAPLMRLKAIAYDFCRPPADVRVRADADQLVGILTNLLSNAGKFTPSGGEVHVTCDVGADVVRLSVEDTGIGIPPDLHERIFEPFFQVETGFTRTTMGTGLGLSISRASARAMGGDITIEPTPGGGSRFTVVLRRAG